MTVKTQVKLLPVKPFQETLHGGYCGPASLKIVLDYFMGRYDYSTTDCDIP